MRITQSLINEPALTKAGSLTSTLDFYLKSSNLTIRTICQICNALDVKFEEVVVGTIPLPSNKKI